MALKFRKGNKEHNPSIRRKLFLALGSIAAILLVSSIISVMEQRYAFLVYFVVCEVFVNNIACGFL